MKKKNKLFALLLLPVIGMTVISGCSSAEKTSTGNEVVVNNNGNDYYLDAGIIVNLGKNGELSAVGCEATEDNNNVQYVDNIAPEKLSKYKSVYINNAIYCVKESNLYKYTFTDNKNILKKEEITINSDAFADEYGSKLIYDLKTDGQYLYFIIKPSMDYMSAVSKDSLYKIGKMSFDGKEVDWYDVVASSYTINDGYIYYFNNGYTPDGDSYSFNFEKSGLYKMKIDGSGKELMYNDFETESDTKNQLYFYNLKDMKVYGDYLYFANYSSQGENKVCRIKKDGSNLETVSKNSAYSLSLDTENNKLYYVGRSDTTGLANRKCYEISLDTFDETELFEISINEPDIYYYNNYLYLNYADTVLAADISTVMIGERYDTVNKKLELLYGYYNRQEIKDGIFTTIKYEGPYLEWKSE
jgi:lipoprotein